MTIVVLLILAGITIALVFSQNGVIRKSQEAKENTKAYYKEGIRLLLQTGETMENFEQVLEEYKSALIIRNKRIDDLYNEIKIIKRLKV